MIFVWFEVLLPSQQLWSCRDGPFCDIVPNVNSSLAINFPERENWLLYFNYVVGCVSLFCFSSSFDHRLVCSL